jgi:cysteinyl-tRNA synthetase
MVINASPLDIIDESPPPEVIALAEERLNARSRKDWQAADEFRRKINSLGWNLQDKPDGYSLVKG